VGGWGRILSAKSAKKKKRRQVSVFWDLSSPHFDLLTTSTDPPHTVTTKRTKGKMHLFQKAPTAREQATAAKREVRSIQRDLTKGERELGRMEVDLVKNCFHLLGQYRALVNPSRIGKGGV